MHEPKMDGDHYNEYISKRFIGLSVVAAFLVWCALTWLLTPFVPTEFSRVVYLCSGFTAMPLTGVFFFAMHMFWLVASEHRKARRAA